MLAWKGHTWQLTSGGMAGVCQGDPKNVTVDANGYLHLRISNGTTGWTASEMFTTDRLGLGTYRWQVDGPIDSYDKNVVLGLFPYGPAAGIGADGTNEIDIEYSRWGQASGPNGDWTDYPASGKTIGELSYTFSLGSTTLSTSRLVWSSASIADALLSGLQPIDDGTTGLIKSWTYAPANPTVNIPQQALPLGMNLWCFDSPPSDGQPVEIVIRDFMFVPASGAAGGAGTAGVGGAGVPGAGGAGAAGAGGSAGSGQAGAGGAAGHGAGGAGGKAGSPGPGQAGAGGAAGHGAGGAGGKAGSPGPAGGHDGDGGASGIAGSSGGRAGTAGSSGAPGEGGHSGSTGTAGASGSSSGCACAVGDPRATWPPTAFWSVVVLALLPRRARRRPRRRKSRPTR